MNPNKSIIIFDRIAKGQHADADIPTLCQILGWSDRQTKQQLGKYNVNIGEGKDIHIGDRIKCAGINKKKLH